MYHTSVTTPGTQRLLLARDTGAELDSLTHVLRHLLTVHLSAQPTVHSVVNVYAAPSFTLTAFRGTQELCRFASLHLIMQNLTTFLAIKEHAEFRTDCRYINYVF